MRSLLSSKSLLCKRPKADISDKIARFPRHSVISKPASEPLMETSQIKQSIADLAERTNALRGYL